MSTIQFDVFVLSFIFLHFNVQDKKCHKQKCHVLLFTSVKLLACVTGTSQYFPDGCITDTTTIRLQQF